MRALLGWWRRPRRRRRLGTLTLIADREDGAGKARQPGWCGEAADDDSYSS